MERLLNSEHLSIWTVCAYYVDPMIVRVIVFVAAAVGVFIFIRKKKRAKEDRS
jgi:hypothetical protein